MLLVSPVSEVGWGLKRRVCRWCGTVTPGVKEASLPRGTLGRALQEAAGDQVNAQVEIPGEKVGERGVRRKVRKRGDEEEAGPGGWAGDGPKSHLKDPGSDSEQKDGLPSLPQTPLSVTQRRGQGVKERERLEGAPFHPQRLGHRHVWSHQLSRSAGVGEGGG